MPRNRYAEAPLIGVAALLGHFALLGAAGARRRLPRPRWELVKGFQDDGITLSNQGEASATSLADAVREAQKLLKVPV